ncbi:hypothetical protein EV356DRAFT_450567 [Viridothelium virens]|uniref:NAD dependent epimerase/dehydratase n=1 Tax=Viridothelium virens TaxID=1048519 RepID=A0A6A6H2A8_VIRVR|nr:hypothetical protein EV356DRAFT_450567 [Viridothelium virens]
MSNNPVLNALYNFIYPQPSANRTRDRPMRVLALGFSRTGTESLSKALSQLGYDNVYHGFQAVRSAPDAAAWARLALAREAANTTTSSSSPSISPLFTAATFDRILGHCSAVTDAPCCFFGAELLAAYPSALVILNRRRDIDAWNRSIEANFVPLLTSWWYVARSWFHTKAFWVRRCHEHVTRPCYAMEGVGVGRGEGAVRERMERRKRRYEEHYAGLERVLKEQERPYLDWTVEEGWGPLCAFLGDEVPEGPFPSGNDGEALQAMRKRLQRATNEKIIRNLMIFGGVMVASIAVLARYYFGG